MSENEVFTVGLCRKLFLMELIYTLEEFFLLIKNLLRNLDLFALSQFYRGKRF